MGSQGRVDSLKATPIAIIGLSCRLPGSLSSPEEFWRFCCRARSAWSEIPPNRFSAAAYYHPDSERQGSTNVKGGYFLQDDLACFDARFFEMTADEASALDPQQRLMLECAYEALENAGLSKQAIAGQDFGVFAAASFSDYEVNGFRDLQTTPRMQATGCAASFLSNRLSHFFDLHGPSLTVDTACSSSLSALHLACQSLRCGESSYALVGGCHLNLTPDYFISFSLSNLLADSGRCYPFDQRGVSGYGRGEGASCVILKPLHAALADGDPVRAVVLNTGVNQDGRTPGVGVPSAVAQEKLIRSLYSAADIDTEQTGYVEAHGTGTKTGDPIEAWALHRVFGCQRTPADPLLIGSVKSNIGHAEGASGIISVVKTVMMLEKGFVLPNCDFLHPRDGIPLDEWGLKVPTKLTPWPPGKPFASINNFGLGGTNAHAILTSAPSHGIRSLPSITGDVQKGGQPQRIFILSAHTEKSARLQAKFLCSHIEQCPDIYEPQFMPNLAHTLGERRTILPWKVAITAKSARDLVSQLSQEQVRPRRSLCPPSVAFVFNGQGSQWHRMGRELFEAYPVYAEIIRGADEHLVALNADFSLVEELFRDERDSSLSRPTVSQTACTSVQLALTAVLSSWGIHPQAVIGHSSGEIAAAHAAGIIDLRDAIALAYARGVAAESLSQVFPQLKGGMIVLNTTLKEAKGICGGVKDGQVSVACVNSAQSITISGCENGIREVERLAECRSLAHAKLKTTVAYHSHHIKLVADKYLSAIQDIQAIDSHIPFYSSTRGFRMNGASLQPSYWVDNFVSPVQFIAGLTSLLNGQNAAGLHTDCLVEIGPSTPLEGPIRDILKMPFDRNNTNYAPSLRRGRNSIETLHNLATEMFLIGQPIRLQELNFPWMHTPKPRVLTNLPRYPWDHDNRYWHHSRLAQNTNHPPFPPHDLIGSMVTDGNILQPQWRLVFRADDHPWIRGHQFQGQNMFPIAGFITMAVEAALQGSMHSVISPDVLDLREITVTKALLVPDTTAVELMICLKPWSTGTQAISSNWNEFQIYSWTEQRGWQEHCHGLISICGEARPNPVNGSRLQQEQENSIARKLSGMRSICNHPIHHDVLYSTLQGYGMRYENSFRTLRNCHVHGGCAVARTVIPEVKGTTTKLLMHPATLDVCLQTIWLTLGVGKDGLEKMCLPSFIKKLTLQGKKLAAGIKDLRLYGELTGRARLDQPTKHNIWVATGDASQEIVLQVEDLVMKPILDRPPESNDPVDRQLCYMMKTFSYSDIISQKRLSSDTVFEGADSTEMNGQGQPKTPTTSLNITPNAALSGRKVTIVYDGTIKWFPLRALAEGLQTFTGVAPAIRELNKKSNSDEDLCIFVGEAEQPLLANLTPQLFDSIQSLLTTVTGVLWIVRGDTAMQDPAAHMAIGLARSVRAETGLPIATFDVDFTDGTPDSHIVHGILSVLNSAFGSKESTGGLDLEFISREGVISVPRVVPDVATNAQVYKDSRKSLTGLQSLDQQERLLRLAIREYGMLNSLYFTDNENMDGPLEGDDLEIQVHYVGLNFKDVMYANNQLAMDGFGIECSGVITGVGENATGFSVGNRVCAISEGCFANTIRCRSSSAWIIPDEMALDIASTVPVVYCTAFYCLHHVAKLKRGESILIHAAAGGVGQAAISLAQAIGATILATVGSAEKKQFLMDKYALQESQISYSRDLSFVQSVEGATEGRGVDVVLNSLAGEAMQASIKCVAPFGRFVEIGKRDILANSFLELAPLEQNISFTTVDLGTFATARPGLLRSLFESVFNLFRQGIIKPVSPVNTFNAANIGSALQTLQSGRTIGKLVASLRNGPSVKVSPMVRRSLYLNPDASYVVIGGLGGLGQSIIAWLADNGARHIVITSRRDKVAWSNHQRIGILQSKGVTIHVIKCDICEETQVTALDKELSTMRPVAGVIHSAMVLRDTIFEQMTFGDYEAVIRPKVHGLWHLTKMLSGMGSKLDFFIALSSVAGIIGNRGQAAYSAASTFLDAFAAYQRTRSIPFTTIDLAPVRDAGYLANDSRMLAKVSETFGGQTIDESQFHQLLSAIVFPNDAPEISNCHIITGLAMPPDDRARKRMEWLSDPKFALLRGNPETSTSLHPLHSAGANRSLIELVKTAMSRTDAVTAVRNAFTRKLSEIIMCSHEDIECSKPITTCGIDSLSAIGIRQWLSRELEVTLSIFAILNTPSITELVELCLEKYKIVPSQDPSA
ncbi:fatty acid synthase S-acetyltransferase [Aspergillus californicus]